MKSKEIDILTGMIVEEEVALTLEEISHACTVEHEFIIEMVEVGVLEPVGNEQAHWRFSGISLSRVRAALRLQRDLEINPAGLALVLDLLEEINSLRKRVGLVD
jgi:chaperone modulatory protein CbpM